MHEQFSPFPPLQNSSLPLTNFASVPQQDAAAQQISSLDFVLTLWLHQWPRAEKTHSLHLNPQEILKS